MEVAGQANISSAFWVQLITPKKAIMQPEVKENVITHSWTGLKGQFT